MADNKLYYGDNLDVLRRHVADDSVDLVYLDPPFKSNQDYNVLFAQKDGKASSAQIKAFEDTWQWDVVAAKQYEEVVTAGGPVSEALQAFRTFIGTNDMLAYLTMMAPRLVEMRRVLKDTGSIYLHCDPTASHYLKLLMDAVFGPKNFRTEIVWKRTAAHSDTKQGRKQHGRIHDIILFYTKSEIWKWNPIYTEYGDKYVEQHYRHIDEITGNRFRVDNLSAARPGGDTEYEWRIKRMKSGGGWEADLNDEYMTPRDEYEYRGKSPYKGRYWAYSKGNMIQMELDGRIYYTKSGMPCYKRYYDEMPGVSLQDLWIDINPVISGSNERLGYPTQKPELLLDRIIESSSDTGDIIMDPFCGCGTTIITAHKLDRTWIGIDITHLAVNLIKHRLIDTYGPVISDTFETVGEPTTVEGATELAEEDKWQFQWWALGLVGARPEEEKKGADRGIDGRLYFIDGSDGKAKSVIISVKAGKVNVSHVRDLRGTVEREGAAIGVVISMNEPTKPMRQEAADAGFYHSPGWNTEHPKLQLLTIEELIGGKGIDMPPSRGNVTLKKAQRVTEKPAERLELPLETEETE